MSPSNDDQVTTRELLHFLKESIDATRELRSAVDALRTEIASTYVRKDVWLEARKNDAEAGLMLTEKVNRVASVIDWAAKLIAAAVIVALLSLVLVQGPLR